EHDVGVAQGPLALRRRLEPQVDAELGGVAPGEIEDPRQTLLVDVHEDDLAAAERLLQAAVAQQAEGEGRAASADHAQPARPTPGRASSSDPRERFSACQSAPPAGHRRRAGARRLAPRPAGGTLQVSSGPAVESASPCDDGGHSALTSNMDLSSVPPRSESS